MVGEVLRLMCGGGVSAYVWYGLCVVGEVVGEVLPVGAILALSLELQYSL